MDYFFSCVSLPMLKISMWDFLCEESPPFCLSQICHPHSLFTTLHFRATLFSPLDLPQLFSVLLRRGEVWDVGRRRAALSCSMGNTGAQGGNHCHFGAAFIMQHFLLSISMIDRVKGFVVIVSMVMDVVISGLL